MSSQYQLVMQTGPTPGKIFPLEQDVITIGREADNAIVVNDAEVSRKHVQFVFQDGKFTITDLGSTNGTFVNGQRLVGQRVLEPGEFISLGEQISFLFEAALVVDPNATMLSSQPPAFPPMPATATPVPPAPIPAKPVSQPVPPPPPALNKPVPAPAPRPANVKPAPAAPPKNRKILILIVVLLVLCLLCICLAVSLFYVDSLGFAQGWCKYLPFLPYGTPCP